MQYKIIVGFLPGVLDSQSKTILNALDNLGYANILDAKTGIVYIVDIDIRDKQTILAIAKKTIINPIINNYTIQNIDENINEEEILNANEYSQIQITNKISDPLGYSTINDFKNLGYLPKKIKTSKLFLFKQKKPDLNELKKIANEFLCNNVIEKYNIIFNPKIEQKCKEVFADSNLNLPKSILLKEDLTKISQERNLNLDKEELQKIKEYYEKLKRDPTDIEIEIFNQSWSEHCIHKTFRHKIILENGDEINNLLKNTIIRVTAELNYDWCFSVFEDNAGMVDFDEDYVIAVKVETHNHPSALEPFGGASTGVGGCIRDVLGVWAEPFANTNVLCFGDLDLKYSELPKGTKHPKYIFDGVVAGIGDYGNKMGIPTVNGAIYFDKTYTANPLVYCGCFGLLKKNRYIKNAKAGDYLVLVGGKTGKDGIHGVSFASANLNKNSEQTSSCAVQIGDPIQEEKIARGISKISCQKLGSGITDLGGGGLSSAVGEMCDYYKLGAKINLDKVPLKYSGMSAWEIWISESQERMLILSPKENFSKIKKIFENEDVEVSKIGEFTKDKKNRNLKIYSSNKEVADIDINFLFNAIPKTSKKAKYTEPNLKEPNIKECDNYNNDLLKLMQEPNIASKENVIRTYDSTVRGGTIQGSFSGKNQSNPSDAAVIKPILKSKKAVVISCGFNPQYGKIDPYYMAASSVDEAIRNNIATGGRRIALLDNFCWGNPKNKQNLGGLVRAAKACYDTAIAYKTPFISGKDSLYNESESGPITPSLLITAIGIIPNANKKISTNLKNKGNYIYLIGTTLNELGGSHFYKIKGHLGKNVPKINFKEAKKITDCITSAIDNNLIESCHDLSEGGLAVAITEMCFEEFGVEIDLSKVKCEGNLKDYQILFSESNTRFLVEVRQDNICGFEKILGQFSSKIGVVKKEPKLIINGLNGKKIIDIGVGKLKKVL